MFWRTLYDGILETDDLDVDNHYSSTPISASEYRGRINPDLEPTGELAHRQTERLARLVSLALLELPGVPANALAREADHVAFARALHDEIYRHCGSDPVHFDREIGNAENMDRGRGAWLEGHLTPALWRRLVKSAA
jgi:hypothetical protein